MRAPVYALTLALLGFASISAIASADAKDLIGPGRFPQYRDMGGMPGSGFAVLPDGRISILGAMALSTPIGYSLAGGVFDFGFASRSQDRMFRIINVDSNADKNSSDGTGQFLLGIKTSSGNLTLGMHILSSKLDSTFNAQFQPKIDNLGRIGVSIGVQNWTNRGQANGDNDPQADSQNSLSPYVAGTYDLGKGHFATLGYGNTRFRGLFGSVNYQFSPTTKLFLENDTFNWNFGAAYGTYIPKWDAAGKRVRVFITAGFVRSELATWTLNFGF